MLDRRVDLRFAHVAWLAIASGCAAVPPAPAAPLICPGGAAPCRELRVVAHEDDDLLFMNPDLAASLAAGNDVTTVYLTAGTVSEPLVLAAREAGILNAYTWMVAPEAAVTDRDQQAAMLARWRVAPVALGAHQAIRYELAAPSAAGGQVALVFLRLVQINPTLDLAALWRGPGGAIDGVACVDGCVLGSALAAQRYTRDELIDGLAGVIAAHDTGPPLVVSTLDATGLFQLRAAYGEGWVDHADHVAAAQLVVAALARVPARADVPRALVQYRGYDTGREPANLGGATRGKREAFYRYLAVGDALTTLDDAGQVIEWTNRDPDDPHFRLASYEHWTERSYAVASEPEPRGVLAVGERCLRADLTTGDCADAPAWTAVAGRLRPAASPDRCLTLDDLGAASLAACGAVDAEHQAVIATRRGQLRTRDAGCLASTADGLRAITCLPLLTSAGDPTGQPPAAQRWTWR